MLGADVQCLDPSLSCRNIIYPRRAGGRPGRDDIMVVAFSFSLQSVKSLAAPRPDRERHLGDNSQPGSAVVSLWRGVEVV